MEAIRKEKSTLKSKVIALKTDVSVQKAKAADRDALAEQLEDSKRLYESTKNKWSVLRKECDRLKQEVKSAQSKAASAAVDRSRGASMLEQTLEVAPLTAVVASSPVATVSEEAPLPPEYAKYEKMKKMRMPEGAIRQAMQRDGVDPEPFFNPAARAAAAAPAAAPSASSSLGPEYAKYEKMKKMRMPEGAIRQAMQRDGVDPGPFFGEAPKAAAPVPAARPNPFGGGGGGMSLMDQIKASKGAGLKKVTATPPACSILCGEFGSEGRSHGSHYGEIKRRIKACVRQARAEAQKEGTTFNCRAMHAQSKAEAGEGNETRRPNCWAS